MAVPQNNTLPPLSVTMSGMMNPVINQPGPNTHPNTGNLGRPAPPSNPQAQDSLRHPPQPPPPLDQMRAYRACLNCRNRKSKCDLDVNGGRPVRSRALFAYIPCKDQYTVTTRDPELERIQDPNRSRLLKEWNPSCPSRSIVFQTAKVLGVDPRTREHQRLELKSLGS